MKRIGNKAARIVRKRAKAESRKQWAIVSYSVNADSLAAFKRVCEREQVSGSEVINHFIKYYVETSKGR